MTIRTRLMMFVLLVMTASTAVFCGIVYFKMSQALEEEISRAINLAADNKASFVTEWVQSRQMIVSSILGRFGKGELQPILS